MKEKIIPFTVFLVALCLLPYSHQLLLKHQLPEAGQVAGVSTECRSIDVTAQKQALLADYQKAIQPYVKTSQAYPAEKMELDRLINSEYQRYMAKLSALESQNEAIESVSCRPE